MKRAIVAVIFFLSAAGAFAQDSSCTGENIQARSATDIVVTLCKADDLAIGNEITISAGGADMQFVITGLAVSLVPNQKAFELAAKDPSSFNTFEFDTVEVTAKGTKHTVRVLSLFRNHHRYSWSIALANEAKDDESGGASSSAVRASADTADTSASDVTVPCTPPARRVKPGSA